jgi:two-component sensor histidine kinase
LARFEIEEDAWIVVRWFRVKITGVLNAVRNIIRRLIAFRGSLRAYLFIFAFALVLPLFALIGLALHSLVSTEIAKARDQLLRNAQDISQNVDREIFGHLTTLQALATSLTLERGQYQEFHKRAQAALDNRNVSVLLLEPSLQQILNTRVPYGTPLPKTSDEEGVTTVFKTGKPHVSNSFFGKVSKRQVVNVEYPVIRDGIVKYVLVIAIDVENFAETLAGLKTTEGLIVTLSDRNGTAIASVPSGNPVVMAPPSVRPAQPDPATFEYEDAEGALWVEASVRSQLSGWRTSVIASSDLFSEMTWTSIRWLLYALVVTILLTAVLGTIIGRRMADPIHEIRKATNELAEGKAIAPRDLPLKEARAVMSSLSRAADLIATRNASLRESEEKSRENARQINTLMHELAHRNKNQLSIVLAMARQLASTCKDLPEFQEKFVQRIMAKAAAQDLVSRGVGSGVPLDLLLENQMKPFAGENSPQVVATGPEALLKAEAARTLGMAFHELATNATKYGALAKPGGAIHVTWSIDQPQQRLKIEWREIGGPPVKRPERVGFGHNIVDKYTSRMLNARVAYRFEPDGVIWTVEAEGLLA